MLYYLLCDHRRRRSRCSTRPQPPPLRSSAFFRHRRCLFARSPPPLPPSYVGMMERMTNEERLTTHVQAKQTTSDMVMVVWLRAEVMILSEELLTITISFHDILCSGIASSVTYTTRRHCRRQRPPSTLNYTVCLRGTRRNRWAKSHGSSVYVCICQMYPELQSIIETTCVAILRGHQSIEKLDQDDHWLDYHIDWTTAVYTVSVYCSTSPLSAVWLVYMHVLYTTDDAVATTGSTLYSSTETPTVPGTEPTRVGVPQ